MPAAVHIYIIVDVDMANDVVLGQYLSRVMFPAMPAFVSQENVIVVSIH